ncbi:MAG: sugar ABC transporter ATP-binding protein [Verrucomicrobiales bacterium]|nr:sugar ABC transporter ATP-binding protein [Verrucomicrobiales bacterium]
MAKETESSPLRLRIRGVAKRFGPTVALGGVSLEVAPGEVHALIGENGAGKSTLMKVLSGAHQPDAGSLLLDGQPFKPSDPLHARNSGVAMIYQELNLAPDLSVEENMLLGTEPQTMGWLRRGERRRLAKRALEEIGQPDLPLDAPVRSLTIAQQQLVEIARALVGEPRVLIMDEPTSSLTRLDTENLFAVIERMSQRGVSVIYISHFLEECQRVASRFTVLRDGRSVGSGAMAGASLDEIIQLMVGRTVDEIYPHTSRAIGEPVLELRGVAGLVKPSRVDLTLRAGEIVGLFGLVGAGRTETLRAVFGLDRLAKGSVSVFSHEATRSTPAKRLANGVGLLSEDRKEEGLLLGRSIADNLTLTRLGPVTRLGIVNSSAQAAAAGKWMDRLDVKALDAAQPVGELSGGNQQKIALGRLLHHEANILLLDEPTRGIDVGSKAQIYRLMNDLAGRGKAVIFVSSYLPELLGVCDRIGVMCRGELSEVRPVADWSESAIIRAAVGQTETGEAAA